MKDIKPSLLGCGGVIALIGLILFIFFRDSIGSNIFWIGVGMMVAIVLFWILGYVSRYLRNQNQDKNL
jgi:Na+/H+ antiporter NhaC